MDRLNGAAAAALLVCLALAGCGGDSSGTASASSAGGTQTIQGVSTPSSVSVVTAKNATP